MPPILSWHEILRSIKGSSSGLLHWIRSKLANKPRHNRTANWMLHQWCRYAAWM